ncbi:ABC transporter, permease protein (cluster 9, phospholipid) [hydrothermal vent metagenome]|uniref:ABC transporter, permease protein (Cluster 9, phospholipid) n=1 Tax=hydrothermal vent metagenome TaxID=652676 RepID=A0A3B1D7U8_9ZZZZ
MLIFFENIGRTITYWIKICFEFFSLLFETIYWIIASPFNKKPICAKSVFEQMVFMGVQSIIIVFFVVFFTGVVLAMQSAPQLRQMGAVFYVAGLVSVSICRELGPVLTALVIAGRVGAAITAEIGSMKVNEQIEALDTMAINPVRYLVVPKFLALLIMLPCLTIIGDAAGILGGYLIGVGNLKINSGLYIQTAVKFLTMKDIYTGVSKAFIFAMIISIVGAYQGFKTRGGAVGVGKATTVSVVSSFILIIIADCILTAIYFFVDY